MITADETKVYIYGIRFIDDPNFQKIEIHKTNFMVYESGLPPHIFDINASYRVLCDILEDE